MKQRIASLFGLTLFVLGLARPAHADVSVTYLYPDASGSAVAGADESGNLLWRRTYLPFGGEATLSGDADAAALSRTRGFTGHAYDRRSGLVYMGARYYNPELHMFYARDPAGVVPTRPFTYNRYAYANQNPYRFVDPDGEAIFLAAIAVVGVAMTAYDTYQAYQRGGVGAAAEQLAFDAAISVIGGGVAKVGVKVGKVGSLATWQARRQKSA